MNRVVEWVANGDPYDSLAGFPRARGSDNSRRCHAPPYPSRGSWPRGDRDPPARSDGRPESAMIHCRPRLHSIMLLSRDRARRSRRLGRSKGATPSSFTRVVRRAGYATPFCRSPSRTGWRCRSPGGMALRRPGRDRNSSGVSVSPGFSPARSACPEVSSGKNSATIRSGSISEPAIAPPAASSVGSAREAQPSQPSASARCSSRQPCRMQALDRLRRRYASGFEQARETPGTLARSMLVELLADGSRFVPEDAGASVRHGGAERLGRPEVEAWRQAVFARGSLVVAAAGRSTEEAVVAAIDLAFGGLPERTDLPHASGHHLPA